MLEQRWRISEVREKRGRRRKREKVQQLDCIRIQASGWELVEITGRQSKVNRTSWAGAERVADKHTGRNLSSGCGVQDRPRGHRSAEGIGLSSGLTGDEIREISVPAVPFQDRGDGSGQNCSLNASESFVVTKEKKFVTTIVQFRDYDGSPCRESELILTKFALWYPTSIFKKISGVEFVVAEELPRCAMELVGARLYGGVENGGSRTAKFRAEIGSLNFKFLDRIDGRKNNKVGPV